MHATDCQKENELHRLFEKVKVGNTVQPTSFDTLKLDVTVLEKMTCSDRCLVQPA